MRRSMKVLAAVTLWAASGAAAGAQSNHPATTPRRGGSATRPLAQKDKQKLNQKVDAVFAEYDKPDSPGCSLGVIRDGQLIYTRGYGRANLEHHLPITSRTVFDIGSTSKQFTAASILLLEQQGQLSRDDDIRKFVPEIPDYGQRITIRHLLHHTSGLRDYLTLMSLAGIDFHSVTGDHDALAIIARQKELNFAPGAEHLYSNSGYFLLSIIVQRASGKNLRAFAQEHIFGPLAMRDTHYHNDHAEVVPNRASAYDQKEGGGYAIDMSNFEQLGDGAVFTTVEDLLKWDQNFYQPRVGGAALVAGLLAKGHLNSSKELEYATGVVVSKHRGLPTVSHGGAWGGYRAELLRFTEQKFSVVCQCNLGSTNPSQLARRVAEVYLADQMEPTKAQPAATDAPTNAAAGAAAVSEADLGKAAPSPAELAPFAGAYYSEELDVTYELNEKDGKLWTRIRTNKPAELQPAGRDLFVAPFGVRFEFARPDASRQGRPASFAVQAGRVRNIRFVRRGE